MKIINISEKYNVTVLKNVDDKIYFIHNILDTKNRRI